MNEDRFGSFKYLFNKKRMQNRSIFVHLKTEFASSINVQNMQNLCIHFKPSMSIKEKVIRLQIMQFYDSHRLLNNIERCYKLQAQRYHSKVDFFLFLFIGNLDIWKFN